MVADLECSGHLDPPCLFKRFAEAGVPQWGTSLADILKQSAHDPTVGLRGSPIVEGNARPSPGTNPGVADTRHLFGPTRDRRVR
jgi:hypothetical protein